MGRQQNYHSSYNNRCPNVNRSQNKRHSLKVQLNSRSQFVNKTRSSYQHQQTSPVQRAPYHRRGGRHTFTRPNAPRHQNYRRQQPTGTNLRSRRSSSTDSYTRTVTVSKHPDQQTEPAHQRMSESTNSQSFTDGFTVDIKIGDKIFKASVNSHRKVTIINRTIFKLLNWNSCPANYDVVNIPISAGAKTLEIMCVANYQLNVPVILGRDATNQLGFRLSMVQESTTTDNSVSITDNDDVLELNSRKDEQEINNM